MAEKELDPLLCCIESIDLAQSIEYMLKHPTRIRLMPVVTAGDIEMLERRLRVIEKSCGIKFDEAWKTLSKAKKWIEDKDVSMAILVLDRIKRKVKGDIVKQFEEHSGGKGSSSSSNPKEPIRRLLEKGMVR